MLIPPFFSTQLVFWLVLLFGMAERVAEGVQLFCISGRELLWQGEEPSSNLQDLNSISTAHQSRSALLHAHEGILGGGRNGAYIFRI